MRLLLIGTDRTVFKKESAVARRIAHLAEAPVDSIDLIVFSLTRHGVPGPTALTPCVHAYPTSVRIRLLYGWGAFRIARQLLRPDVVSAQDPFETGLIGLCIARFWQVPLVVEMHTDFLTPAFAEHSLLNRIRVLLAGFVLRRASGGYAVSAHVRDAVVKRYGLQVPYDVVPVYTDLARLRAMERAPEKGLLLWVGRFEKEKDPVRALRAFAHARARGFDLQLVLLGAGALEPELRRLAQSLGIEKHVSFPGWRDPAPYLQRAELLLVTSRYEGYGLALVEALAAGVPVLSPDVGVAREAGAVIAEGAYADALSAWLGTARARGVLKLPTYEHEEDFLVKLRACYAAVLTRATPPRP